MVGKADEERFRAAMAAATDKYVKQQGRNTIALNAESDPACAGYARIPGPDACEFCVTMGAHESLYRSESTAGGGSTHGTADDRYHPYCNCQVAMVFRRRGELVARDPVTGETVPYDGAEMVRRYREAGSPTFKKGRARENAKRRGERSKGSSKAPAKNNAAGAKLSEAEFDAAMKSLADAQSADELKAAAARIEASWKRNANGRNKAQWDEMSRFAKLRKTELELGPAMSVEVDQLTPCLVRISDGEVVQTVVKRVQARELRGFNKASGWYVDWSQIPDDAEIYQVLVEGSKTVEGMIAIRDDAANSAVRGLWAVAAPHNQAKRHGQANKRFDGVGGHLFAIAAKRADELGYNGFIHGKADTLKVLEHYIDEFDAVPTGAYGGLGFYIDEDAAQELLRKYSWTNGK